MNWEQKSQGITLYWRSGNCSVKALIVSSGSKCQTRSTEHNAALKPRGKMRVQKIDCIDTKTVSLICKAGSVYFAQVEHIAATHQNILLAKSRKIFVLKERSAEMVQPIPQESTFSETALLKGDYHFQNKSLIHANFYIFPAKRAQWLERNTKP